MNAAPTRVTREEAGAFLARAAAGRVPISGSIAMTHRCNLRCVHCYLCDGRSPGSAARELDTSFWLSVVDQVAEAGCLNLLITGGEPFLRGDFAEVYLRAKRRGLVVTVFTNATRLDDSLVRLFTEYPPWFLEVSLYGASKETYDLVTTVPGSFERCLAGVDVLLAAGVRVGLKTVMLRENLHEVRAMRALAEARGPRFRVDPAIFPCMDGNAGPVEHRVPVQEAVAIELEDARRLDSAAEYLERARAIPPGEKLFNCGAGLTGFHVSPEGMLQPCLMVGNHGFDLRTGTFRAGWDDTLRRFREMEAPPGYECNSCEQRFLCGVCPAQTTLETGSPVTKARYYCSLGRERERIIETHAGPALPGRRTLEP